MSSYQTIYQIYGTLWLVLHSQRFEMRLNSLISLLFGFEGNIARWIVDPFDLKVRVDIKIISNELVTHIIDSEQIPCVWTNSDILLTKIRHLFLCKKLYIIIHYTLSFLNFQLRIKSLNSILNLSLLFLQILNLFQQYIL